MRPETVPFQCVWDSWPHEHNLWRTRPDCIQTGR